MIVTIQKITTMMRKFEVNTKKDSEKIQEDLRVAFGVDECHRAVTPQTQGASRLFPQFALVWLYRHQFSRKINESSRRFGTNHPPTIWRTPTRYTVKEAIHGTGFKVDYRNTIISRRFLKKIFLTLSMKIKNTCWKS